jgi:GAF domain-containing protein
VETARSQEIVIIADTRDEPRWPGFGAAALDCGVHSMLCAPLWVGEQRFGTLTLFSAEPAAFSQQDIRLLELFTALAALALAEAQRAEQLREAIRSRDLIGQAKGILMERERIDDKTAFRRARTSTDAASAPLLAHRSSWTSGTCSCSSCRSSPKPRRCGPVSYRV